MFERRLKILLGLLGVVTAVLVLRAAQVQVLDRDDWRKAATETMKRTSLLETVRGSLLDYKGRVIARDEACVDACVDYRALTDPPNEKWVHDFALERLKSRLGDEYSKALKARKAELLTQEEESVHADIQRMWVKLAHVSGKSIEQINDIRQQIISKIEMRRRLVWYRNYQHATAKKELEKPEAFWKKWLDDEKDAPELDNFAITVSEEGESHVILRAIDNSTQNELGKYIERYPGLVLRPGTHRSYPFGPVACHLMGRVSKVTRDDLLKDPEPTNEIRKYWPNDEIGRGGVEALCEHALRGDKGTILKVVGEKDPRGRTEPVAGKDVRITIDMELQARIEDAFAHAELVESDGSIERAVLHGAAIVIDVPTSEVRALVSYPTYDLNTFEEHYAELYYNQVDMPLLNRATMSQLTPGSTIKPVVGLSAITAGIFGVNDTIECKGYMYVNGRPIMNANRCWVASKFTKTLNGNVAHHPVPSNAPHPTGFLTFADALERSCNVFFQTLAERFGFEQLSVWYEKFGLGRHTGIGIAEASGRLPRDNNAPISQLRSKLWFSGIGQDPVAVTPIQMANNAATIARNGIWMRPRLVSDRVAYECGITPPLSTTRPGGPPAKPIPNWVDLHLSPEGLAASHEGMFRVVYGPAGTGTQILHGATMFGNFKICGKTGTATASKYAIKILDNHHQPVLGENGRPTYRFLEPSTKAHPNLDAPWYRGYGDEGKDLNHAWYIGFAPAEHPKVAFAVMVEYGGSGGGTGGAVARKVLEACVHEGYLP